MDRRKREEDSGNECKNPFKSERQRKTVTQFGAEAKSEGGCPPGGLCTPAHGQGEGPVGYKFTR